MDNDPLEDKDAGPLAYQESKVFHQEIYLCNVYDNTTRRYITFEVYGLDTQEMLTLGYDYQAYDGLFRFNAELMNPNRKEGRFHWTIERLAIVTVGSDRKLQLKPEPSEEVPELPIYETTRKIPTGRMDLKERQRLREQMDMLDIKRAENIAKRRRATKERFLKHIFKLKEDFIKKNEDVEAKIEQERLNRYKAKEEAERKEREEEAKIEAQASMRRKSVEVKEQRTEEQDEEEYRQLRARWRVKDAEKAKQLKDAEAEKAKELAAKHEAKVKADKHVEDIREKRRTLWKARDERVKRKEDGVLKKVLAVKHEMQRLAKMQLERNQEFIKLLHAERQPIFAAQLQRTEERRLSQIAEEEALSKYVEKREIPKKVKTKGTNSVRGQKAAAAAKAPKEGEAKKDGGLDNVEAKMRQQMEQQMRFEKLEKKRQERIAKLVQKRIDDENKHNQEYRQAHREEEEHINKAAAERQLVLAQKMDEQQAAAERRKNEMARLEKVRTENIGAKMQARLAAIAAS